MLRILLQLASNPSLNDEQKHACLNAAHLVDDAIRFNVSSDVYLKDVEYSQEVEVKDALSGVRNS